MISHDAHSVRNAEFQCVEIDFTASCKLRLIPRLKQPLHGKQFANRDDILTTVWHMVAQISMSGDDNGVCCLPHDWQ
jgi:hypothetical protein